MKLIHAVLVVLLARTSIYASVNDPLLPKSEEDPEPGPATASSTATTTATVSSSGNGGSGSSSLDDLYGDDAGGARHRTRIGLPGTKSASSSSSSTGEDPDHPRHHHRFHRTEQQESGAGAATADVVDNDGPTNDATKVLGDDEESSRRKMKLAAGVEPAGTGPEQGADANHEEGSSTGASTKESKRLWGAAAAATSTAAGGSAGDGLGHSASSSSSASSTSTSSSSAATNQQTSVPHQPNLHDESSHNQTRAFVVPKAKPTKTPPDGYELSARVYIDPRDRLAHFDSTPQRIPYWDCGYIGSTTSPLPLKSAYFRHALTGATSWSGTDGKHAVLVVALSPIAMDLNSGESREFAAGSVILLEDVLIAGHKMRPLASSREGVSVLFLTLPHQFTHTGRDHTSLPTSFLKPAHRDDPCPNDHAPGDSTQTGSEASSKNATDGVRSMRGDDEVSGDSSIDLIMGSSGAMNAFWQPRNVRRAMLGVFGLSLSSLAADFLAKTAPLWLAVGVGGTCFVAAGTWAMSAGGDALWMAIELQLERRRLGATSVDASLILEDDSEADGISMPKM